MTDVALAIQVNKDSDDFQYAIELEGSLSQLAMLNGLLDVAKKSIVEKIDMLSQEE